MYKKYFSMDAIALTVHNDFRVYEIYVVAVLGWGHRAQAPKACPGPPNYQGNYGT